MAATYFCKTCDEQVEAEVDEAEGHAFCALCGLQLEDLLLDEGPSFVKTGDTARLAGSIIRDEQLSKAGGGLGGGYGGADESRERSISKGGYWLRNFAYQLQVPNTQAYIDRAKRVYLLAISKGFTRGRRTNQVAAACLYVTLRQEREPYMLIDFCHLLSVNVYILGATYLRLIETLRLDTHPVLVCAVDPSLYLHRFAGKLQLLPGKLDMVVQTAMQLIAQMKRDWMQTGRRPAGVCGAALWLACHIHGCQVSRKEVIRVVSVGESTIMHRVSELRGTHASGMTLVEFKEHAKKCLEMQRALEQGRASASAMQEGVLTVAGDGAASGACCRHVISKSADHFAMGMCQPCYITYVQASGGIIPGAADPPAYTANLCKDLTKMKKDARHEALRFVANAADHTLPLPPQQATPGLRALTYEAGSPGPRTGGLRENGSGRGKGGRKAQRRNGSQRAARKGKLPRVLTSESMDEEGDGPEREQIEPVEEPSRGGRPCGGAAAGRQKAGGSGSVDAVEAEFALALLQNESVRELATALAASRADLPAVGVQEARALVAAAQGTSEEGLLGVGGPVSGEASGGGLSSLHVARFFELQRGPEVDVVASAEPAFLSSESRERALALCLDNAEAPRLAGSAAAARLKSARGRRTPGISIAAEATGAAPGADAVADGALVALEDAPGGAADEVPSGGGDAERPELWSDIDDEEIAAYIATEEEARVKGEIWTTFNQDWIEKQAAKAAAAAAVEAAQAEVRRAAPPRRPRVAFKPGATAEQSVLNMFEAKNMSSRVNKEAIHGVFEAAARLGSRLEQAPATVDQAPVPKGVDTVGAGEGAERETQAFLAERTQVGVQLKELEREVGRKQAARSGKHSAALARERGAASANVADIFGAMPLAADRPRPGRRLGRLT